MNSNRLPVTRVQQLLTTAAKTRVLVVGDVMLDQFLWGQVSRISPEAPVPVVEFQRESFMPGGAANVARNLAALNVPVELFGVVGRDQAAQQLKVLLAKQKIGCRGLVQHASRPTSLKTRIVAHQQQLLRVDREARDGLDESLTRQVLSAVHNQVSTAAAVIVGDYGKGVLTQPLLDEIKRL